MKNLVLKAVLGAVVATSLCAAAALATDVNITVNPADAWVGYMNVSEIPANGGAFLWGSGWGTADLCAVFTGSDLRLSPNTIGDPNPYWYTPAGGPGAVGNKIMEGNMYVEPAGSLPGVTLNFTGTVISNTLASSHVAKAFVRDFAADFSSVNEQSVVLPASGNFALTINTINDPARHVQWGFQIKGPDVWYTDLAPYGAVVVGPAQATPTTPTTWGKLKTMYR
jgi:hypothetical protein